MTLHQPRSLIHPVQLREIARLAREAPPGDLAEVGVYRGGSAWHLARVAREQGRVLHLFDTFNGTPEASDNDPHRVGEFADITLEEVRAAVGESRVVYYPGVFPETLSYHPIGVSFVHVDCDQEVTVEATIRRFWPYLVKGGAMLFDDYPYLEGARLAVERHFVAGDLLWTEGDRAYVVKRG